MDNSIQASSGIKEKKGVPFRVAALFMIAIMLSVTIFTPLTKTADAAISPGAVYTQSVASGVYGGAVLSSAITSNDTFTYLTLVTNERLRFVFGYNRNSITIRIVGATSFPSTLYMSANPIFTSGRWAGDTLTLNLTTRDGFVGYHSFYDDADNMVIRFRNPPSSMFVSRIVIDPGHGGRDRGAEGFRRDMPEAVINQQISALLAEELRRRGATVLVLDTARGMEISERVRQAERFNADFLISIHNNASARNPSARGTEVYFFTRYSNVMAATISRNVSGRLNTVNRGARRARFAITMSPQFISVMVEAGFVTNREEYEKLINPFYQQEIAQGIANAIDAVIVHIYPGTGRHSRG